LIDKLGQRASPIAVTLLGWRRLLRAPQHLVAGSLQGTHTNTFPAC
jgi:hypothetical protein